VADFYSTVERWAEIPGTEERPITRQVISVLEREDIGEESGAFIFENSESGEE